jgi:protein involved in polysaccharide export with SLBB domain
MRSLRVLAVIGGLFLVSGQSQGAEPAPPAAAVQPVAKDFVTVYGQVMRQGRYQLNAPMTVPQVLQLSGGPTDRANLRKVKVIRKMEGKNVSIYINLKRAEAVADLLVKPGDVIIVDEVLKDF